MLRDVDTVKDSFPKQTINVIHIVTIGPRKLILDKIFFDKVYILGIITATFWSDHFI